MLLSDYLIVKTEKVFKFSKNYLFINFTLEIGKN